MLLMWAFTVATLMNNAAANLGVGLALGDGLHDLSLAVAERLKPILCSGRVLAIRDVPGLHLGKPVAPPEP